MLSLSKGSTVPPLAIGGKEFQGHPTSQHQGKLKALLVGRFWAKRLSRNESLGTRCLQHKDHLRQGRGFSLPICVLTDLGAVLQIALHSIALLQVIMNGARRRKSLSARRRQQRLSLQGQGHTARASPEAEEPMGTWAESSA